MTGDTFVGLSFGVQNLKKIFFSEWATLMLASLVDRGVVRSTNLDQAAKMIRFDT